MSLLIDCHPNCHFQVDIHQICIFVGSFEEDLQYLYDMIKLAIFDVLHSYQIIAQVIISYQSLSLELALLSYEAIFVNSLIYIIYIPNTQARKERFWMLVSDT